MLMGLLLNTFCELSKMAILLSVLVFTDQDTGTKTENRVAQLKDDFNQPDLISVEMTKLSTFEKDLIDSNKSGGGKKVLIETLKLVKPTGELSLKRPLVKTI